MPRSKHVRATSVCTVIQRIEPTTTPVARPARNRFQVSPPAALHVLTERVSDLMERKRAFRKHRRGWASARCCFLPAFSPSNVPGVSQKMDLLRKLYVLRYWYQLQTCYLADSRYSDTRPTSSSTDARRPGAWQGSLLSTPCMTRAGKPRSDPRVFRLVSWSPGRFDLKGWAWEVFGLFGWFCFVFGCFFLTGDANGLEEKKD